MNLYFVISATADNYIMAETPEGLLCSNCSPDGRFAGVDLYSSDENGEKLPGEVIAAKIAKALDPDITEDDLAWMGEPCCANLAEWKAEQERFESFNRDAVFLIGSFGEKEINERQPEKSKTHKSKHPPHRHKNDIDGYWYAVVKEGDSDWGTGSFDYEEARQMARELSDSEDNRHYIAFINVGQDGEADSLCVKEVHFDDKELGFIPVLVNGERKMMTYEAVCKALHMDPSVFFVVVKKNGKIGFTCGKDHEVLALLYYVKEARFCPTDSLFFAAMGRKMGKADRLEYQPTKAAPSRPKNDIAL